MTTNIGHTTSKAVELVKRFGIEQEESLFVNERREERRKRREEEFEAYNRIMGLSASDMPPQWHHEDSSHVQFVPSTSLYNGPPPRCPQQPDMFESYDEIYEHMSEVLRFQGTWWAEDGDVDDDDESDSEAHDYSAQDQITSYSPHESENHLGQTLSGEVLAGGMPRRKRPKDRAPRPRRMDVIAVKKHIVDDRTRVWLTYCETDYLTAAGQERTAYAWHTNDPYDVYPGTGGATDAGWEVYKTLYQYFRSPKYRITCEVFNTQAYPICVYFLNSTVDWSTGTTTLAPASTNAYCYSRMLAPAGTTGASYVYQMKGDILRLTGLKSPLIADNFQGNTDGSIRVADHTYFTLGIDTHSTNVLTTGLYYKLRVENLVEFYGRAIQTS